ncbi:MAG: ABC transporter ATP-binding protein [Alcaligenaceae bacterium]|nr:ABC transporter ATP-binding protein [Alcaligenaceae bacterium]
MENHVRIDHLSHRFINKKTQPYPVLHNINLSIRKGEVVCLVGNSGCGKSTLIQMLAGLERPSEGVLICNNREISGPGPDRALVLEQPTLLPWLSCFQNVYLAVEQVFGARETPGELRARARAALTRVGLLNDAAKFPGELSAGMRQRVSIARAIAMEPKVLLMDEPFNALDPLTRSHLQDDVLRIVGTLDTTVIMVSHDVDEALLMADRIVLLTQGPAATIGTIVPVDLPRPRNRLTVLSEPRYLELRTRILTFLHDQRHHREPELHAA